MEGSRAGRQGSSGQRVPSRPAASASPSTNPLGALGQSLPPSASCSSSVVSPTPPRTAVP